MGHPRIRVPKQPAPRRPWIERTLVISGALIALALTLFTLWDRPHAPYIFTEGNVTETRIVADSIRDSLYGGRIYYRLEARVRYDLAGQPQDRWLTASEVTTNRQMLAAAVARSPKVCRVFWPQDHPEGALCRLEDPLPSPR
jgi:hypothetical protein